MKVNAIETIKSAKDCMDIKNQIEQFAREGWESISEEDVHRLKWYGLFLRKPTPGYFMLRVRIPNGFAFSHQVRALAQISTEFGNGQIDITTRQQVQVRHLKIEYVPAVFELMESVGLTSMQTGMDNVRNIMGCPVAGLHPREAINASSIVAALTHHIVGNRDFTNLPRKFNIAITGCPDNCIHTETQDLALVPAVKIISGREAAGFNIIAGGKMGSGGYRIASPLNIFVTPEEAVSVSSEIILLFRDCGSRESRTQSRLAFLLDEWGEERFRSELEKRMGLTLATAGKDLRGNEHSDHVGVYRQKQLSMNYVGLKVVVGRIKADLLHRVAELAERYGNGEIRFTPGQNLILPHVSDKKLAGLLDEEELKELLYAPSPVMRKLVACVGSDYCSLAAIETKSRAKEVAAKLEQMMENVRPISMHWSGCPAGCGNHLVADIGLLGKKARIDGKTVDAVDVYVGGRAGPHPKQAVKLLENVPCDQLPEVLNGIIPYHSREKMHPIKTGKGARKKANAKKPVAPEIHALVPAEAL